MLARADAFTHGGPGLTCAAPAGGQAAYGGDDEHPGDDRQRDTRADLRDRHRPDVIHPRSAQRFADELDPDERKDGSQASGQMDEPPEQPADQEVEVAQAQQSEQVRGEHQEGVPGQAEDRRNGVEREQHIGHADRDDQDQQRGGVPAPPHPRGQAGPFAPGRDRHDPACDPHDGAVPGFPRCAAAERHPRGRVQEERPEEILHPAEPVQRCAPDPDQQAAQQECQQNPEQQNAAVVLTRHPGTGDKDDENKEIVQRQAVLGQPSGKELARCRAAASGGDQRTEGHCQRDRRDRPHRRLGQAHRPPPPGADDEVGTQENAKGRDGRGPGPEGNVEDFHDLSGQAPIRAPDVPFAAGRADWTG